MDTQNQSQAKWHYGTQISFRATDEIREVLSNAYHAITGSDEKIPMNVFMQKIIDLAVSSLVIREELQASITKVQQLETKIEDLQLISESSSELSEKLEEIKELNQNISSENERLSSEIEGKNLNIQSLITENERLRANLSETAIPEDTVLVSFSDLENAVINRICQKESRRTNKTITPEILLKNTLIDYLIHGPRDFFPRLSEKELKNIKQSLYE